MMIARECVHSRRSTGRTAITSATAGLLSYITERHDEMPAEIMATVEPGSVWERVKYWWKENW